MAKDTEKLIRQLSLISYLMAERRPVTATEIRRDVEGYSAQETATILGVAHALGETAPLLLIGMKAFVASVPATPLDQATALPVQIYLWQGNENRNFFEPRTAAAIMVLLAVMILLNGVAIYLRSRLEKRA